MKNHKRTSAHKNTQRKPASKPSSDNMVVFGFIKNKGHQASVMGNGVEYAISGTHRNVRLPLADNTGVKALITTADKRSPSVKLLKAYGPRLQLRERIAQLLTSSEVVREFSPKTLREAQSFGTKVQKNSIKERLDLTSYPLCTIDGETAKDFDDAVFAKKSGNNIMVVVAIADVSHYVRQSSSLDEDAYLRGTSIYYPGHCIPMLPEELSNGLCSLRPNELRLAICVTFELGPKGGIFKPRIKQAVIKSHARLTYTQVQGFYDSDESAKGSIDREVEKSLIQLRKAAHILRRARQRRGAIDFDVTETNIALDDEGEPIAIHPQDRLDSHRIIEDLMVATNEIVADYFETRHLPCIFRVHESPDQEKLETFFKTAHAFGAIDKSVKTKPSSITEPKDLQDLMKHYQKSRYKETLSILMLRSMMQARYSEQNLMHFGLASTAYLHFTSPIRRYADLMVHRQLRNMLFEKNYKSKIPEHVMAKIAESISQKEVRATEIERKIDRLHSATFMSSRIGETFDAAIVSVTEFGFFVRISEHHVEGLVHIATISRSHVIYVPDKMCLVVSGSNKKYMVGDKVSVKLINVNIDRGHVDFELSQAGDEKSTTKESFRSKRPKDENRMRPKSRPRRETKARSD